jgi:hypothetical protein
LIGSRFGGCDSTSFFHASMNSVLFAGGRPALARLRSTSARASRRTRLSRAWISALPSSSAGLGAGCVIDPAGPYAAALCRMISSLAL